jgi:hypothetical protein
MQQRAISADAVEATRRWGLEVRLREGRRGYFLGRRQVAAARAQGAEVGEHENTAIVVGPRGGLVTTVRTRSPRRLRRRAK